MTYSPTLEDCQRVKELGYPQDGWPQMVYRRLEGYYAQGTWTDPRQFFADPTERKDGYASDWVSGYLVAPSWLSGDPEHPGILEWLEQNLGWQWGKMPGHLWYVTRPTITSPRFKSETLSGLLSQIYEHEIERRKVEAEA